MEQEVFNTARIPTTLYTNDGDEVVTVNVPPFNPPAEILQWGARYFVYDVIDKRYIEGMLYFVPPIEQTGE
jgi:hypothetical protein